MGDPKIKGGFILLSRKLIESEIFKKPPLYLKVWIYLLSKAQHSDFKKLTKGQLITDVPEIQEACSYFVGYRKEKPTKAQIYQILDWLRKSCEGVNEADTKATMITTTKATHHILINIENYSFYQDFKNYEANSESNNEKTMKTTRKRQQPDNINNNDNNNDNNEQLNNNMCVSEEVQLKVKKQEEYSKEFEMFWNAYPRRHEKKKAYRVWNARIKEKILATTLIKAAENYTNACKKRGTEEKFIKHPSTFLGPDRPYEEYLQTGGGTGEINRPNNKWDTSKFLYHDDGKTIEGDDNLM